MYIRNDAVFPSPAPTAADLARLQGALTPAIRAAARSALRLQLDIAALRRLYFEAIGLGLPLTIGDVPEHASFGALALDPSAMARALLQSRMIDLDDPLLTGLQIG